MNLDKFIFTIFTSPLECCYVVMLPHLSKFERKTQIVGDLSVLDQIDESNLIEVKRLGQCSYKISYLEIHTPSKAFHDYQMARAFVRQSWVDLVASEKSTLEPQF